MRLNLRQWAAALLIVVGVLWMAPWIWKRCEKFETGPNYRIPYPLSKDYWLYQRRADKVVNQDKILLLGDSVVWGEYVAPDGTLSHFLNDQAGAANQFVNLGINGLFPLAEEGLINYYGQSIGRERVLIHLNFLWLTSPKADLSIEKKQRFNHSRLTPQFSPRIPCYRADVNERLGAIVERNISFLQWVGHVQDAYFGQKSVPSWTLEDDGGSPARHTNSYRNPLTEISFVVPPEPKDDPQRGPKSARHRAWSAEGQGSTSFEWVSLEDSLQWRAFQRIVEELRRRGNSVFVVIGPFNEHMLTQENGAIYRKLRTDVGRWLEHIQVPCSMPDALPSELYADSSHPLTQGYQLLAQRLFADPQFRSWLQQPSPKRE